MFLGALALTLISLTTQDMPTATLTGNTNIVQATFVGSYTPNVANTAQAVTYEVSGVKHTANIILGWDGSSATNYKNGVSCMLLLPGSTPFNGTEFGATTVRCVLGRIGQGWVHLDIPISTTGVFQVGFYIGQPGAPLSMYYYYPSFAAGGIDLLDGVTGLWDNIPKSFNLPLASTTAGTTGNVTFYYIPGLPGTADCRITGAGAGQANSYEWGGSGTMTSMTMGGILTGAPFTVSDQAVFDTSMNSNPWHG